VLLVVDFCGIEHASAFDGDTVIFRVYAAKEAGSITFMAGGIANLVDFQQQCVSVAVKIDGFEFLNIPAIAAPLLFREPKTDCSRSATGCQIRGGEDCGKVWPRRNFAALTATFASLCGRGCGAGVL